MITYMCLKDCGLFKQGKKYAFAKPTAQALSAARAGYLKPLASGGVVSKLPWAGEDPTVPIVARKRGRPRKANP